MGFDLGYYLSLIDKLASCIIAVGGYIATLQSREGEEYIATQESQRRAMHASILVEDQSCGYCSSASICMSPSPAFKLSMRKTRPKIGRWIMMSVTFEDKKVLVNVCWGNGVSLVGLIFSNVNEFSNLCSFVLTF